MDNSGTQATLGKKTGKEEQKTQCSQKTTKMSNLDPTQ